eukprot:g44039.t1
MRSWLSLNFPLSSMSGKYHFYCIKLRQGLRKILASIATRESVGSFTMYYRPEKKNQRKKFPSLMKSNLPLI